MAKEGNPSWDEDDHWPQKEKVMKVTVTVEREYEMDKAKVIADFGPVPDGIPEVTWLRESFYELCGAERDEDHVDGSYVKLIDETVDDEWEAP